MRRPGGWPIADATIDGVPIGLSIIGGRGSDTTLIAVAQALEAAT